MKTQLSHLPLKGISSKAITSHMTAKAEFRKHGLEFCTTWRFGTIKDGLFTLWSILATDTSLV